MPALLHLEVPDIASSIYAERSDKEIKLLDHLAIQWVSWTRTRLMPHLGRLQKVITAAEAMEGHVAELNDTDLRMSLGSIAKQIVRKHGHPQLAYGMALIREAARRSLGVLPYPTQLIGAAVLLEGRLAEMQTGEGKTITAALAACLAGVAGLPVHVVTVNDYLVGRDAEEMGPLYRFFALSVGKIQTDMSHEDKRRAYACSITYCTNKDLVFDYLRDRVTTGSRANKAQVRVRALHGKNMRPLLLKGLHFAIVDEADSILIDEARTPLILSEKSNAAPDAGIYQQALNIACNLEQGKHFEINPSGAELHLTTVGQQEVSTVTQPLGGIWRAARAREHLVAQALRALHIFRRDVNYLIADDKVHIIDEYTGRILPGRSWEQGLHQMIEAKEGCSLSKSVHTLARITYQRFFRRYLRLSGMTGTAQEVAGELQSVYGLDVVTVPTYRPCARIHQPAIVCKDAADKWQQIAATVLALQATKRPVLIGTRSVEASDALSHALKEAGIEHCVLNARQDAEEAEVVASAGKPGAVTVATNMAGRGTDIRLAPEVKAQGGLTVILTEFHESARIDRQLFGRCARQGEPGQCITIVAFDDALYRQHGGWIYRLLKWYWTSPESVPSLFINLLRHSAQNRAERLNYKIRSNTLKQDRNFDNALAFAGNQI